MSEDMNLIDFEDLAIFDACLLSLRRVIES